MGNSSSAGTTGSKRSRGDRSTMTTSPQNNNNNNNTINARNSSLGDGIGDGLFAEVDLKPGDIIVLITDPYVNVPQSNALTVVCYHCMRQNPDLKKCIGCKAVSYCSKSCQSASWNDIHKLECKIFKKLEKDKRVLPTSTRALLQMILRQRDGIDPDPRWSRLLNHKFFFLQHDESRLDLVLQSQAAVAYATQPFSIMDAAYASQHSNLMDMAMSALATVSHLNRPDIAMVEIQADLLSS
jgi:hypothetical protein